MSSKSSNPDIHSEFIFKKGVAHLKLLSLSEPQIANQYFNYKEISKKLKLFACCPLLPTHGSLFHREHVLLNNKTYNNNLAYFVQNRNSIFLIAMKLGGMLSEPLYICTRCFAFKFETNHGKLI